MPRGRGSGGVSIDGSLGEECELMMVEGECIGDCEVFGSLSSHELMVFDEIGQRGWRE